MPTTVSSIWTYVYYLLQQVLKTPYALKLRKNEPKFEIGDDDKQRT